MTQRVEVRSIDPLRAANITGVVAFAVYGILAIPMAVLFAIMGTAFSQAEGAPPLPGAFSAVIACVYPIMGGVFGWIFGGLAALIYNFAVRWTGGHLLELDGV